MPTPFTHLHITLRLMQDEAIPQKLRDFAMTHRPDFLLGGIVADQRPEGGKRADTHFYEYIKPMTDHPWRVMFQQNPSLKQAKSDAHHAFLLAYVAHLAADEYWSLHMLKPHFAESDWGDDLRHRFYLLHLLLITMDERDETRLPEGIGAIMQECKPDNWLPFLSDDLIIDWRDYLAHQIDDHDSKTLDIFGGRIDTAPEKVRELLDDAYYMQRNVWNNVSREILADVETKLYDFAREQLIIYWDESSR
ncbi:MAG: zinc dependent phospholipase C family protein [Chloroflexota bacterium]